MSSVTNPKSNKERLKKLVHMKAKAQNRPPIEVLRELQHQLEERAMAKKN